MGEPLAIAFKPEPVFMQRAIDLASENVRAGLGGPFAALIVREGVVVAEAANSVTASNDPTAHGEVNAIRRACERLGSFSLEGCEIYSSCEPCPMCLGAIHWARIKMIYFGNNCDDAARAGFDDSFLYTQFKLTREQRAIPAQQYMAKEAWGSFQLWLDSGIKVNY